MSTAKFEVIRDAPAGQAPTARNGAATPTAVPSDKAIVTCLADVEARPFRWLWPDRIALGKVTMIAGDPGLGKSQLLVGIAAVVSAGAAWPLDEGQATAGNVILLSAEDDPADTIKPRLVAAGGDPERVHVLEAIRVKRTNGRRVFDLSQDLDRLKETLAEIGDVRMVGMDPITAYLGKIDSHVNAEVRGLMAQLQDFAEQTGVAVVGVSHLAKAGGKKSVLRINGSVAFGATGRTVWFVERDDDDPDRRVFLSAKNNIGPDRSGLAFRVVERSAGGDLRAPVVEWEEERVMMSADEWLAREKDQLGDPHRLGKYRIGWR